jgi:hypothetical protein
LSERNPLCLSHPNVLMNPLSRFLNFDDFTLRAH